MSNIKCPNCGSSAQVSLVWASRSSYSDTCTKEYECGCGCHFEATFELKKIKILEEDA